MARSLDFYQLSSRLDGVDITALVGADGAAAFEQERAALVRAVADGQSTPDDAGERLATLVRDHPPLAARILPARATRTAAITAPQTQLTDLATATATSTGPLTDSPSAPALAEAGGGDKPPVLPRDHRRGGKGDDGRWTPEVVLTVLKESVTAVIGLAIIGFTLYIALRASWARNTGETTHLRDLLTLLLSLAGVVLGYYFGRVPGEARATSAEQRARRAEAHTRMVGEQAEQLADSLDAALSSATRAMGDEEDTSQLRRLRNELRQLSRAARGLDS